jgi:hypothetical protein
METVNGPISNPSWREYTAGDIPRFDLERALSRNFTETHTFQTDALRSRSPPRPTPPPRNRHVTSSAPLEHPPPSAAGSADNATSLGTA